MRKALVKPGALDVAETLTGTFSIQYYKKEILEVETESDGWIIISLLSNGQEVSSKGKNLWDEIFKIEYDAVIPPAAEKPLDAQPVQPEKNATFQALLPLGYGFTTAQINMNGHMVEMHISNSTNIPISVKAYAVDNGSAPITVEITGQECRYVA